MPTVIDGTTYYTQEEWQRDTQAARQNGERKADRDLAAAQQRITELERDLQAAQTQGNANLEQLKQQLSDAQRQLAEANAIASAAQRRAQAIEALVDAFGVSVKQASFMAAHPDLADIDYTKAEDVAKAIATVADVFPDLIPKPTKGGDPEGGKPDEGGKPAEEGKPAEGKPAGGGSGDPTFKPLGGVGGSPAPSSGATLSMEQVRQMDAKTIEQNWEAVKAAVKASAAQQ